MNHIDVQPFDGWYESTIEDFCDNVAPHFGLTVNPSDVSSSGFWCQGDGASFEGLFYLLDVSPATLKESMPTEVELHNLIDELAELANEHPEIQGKVTRLSSRYSHSNTMVIGDWSSNQGYDDADTEAFASAGAETTLMRIFRELADWLYSCLNSEYDYQLADATASQWAVAIEERKLAQDELDQLKADVAANPPQSQIQSRALNTTIAALEVEIESLESKIEQLASQFSYWPKGGNPYNIEQFYENYL